MKPIFTFFFVVLFIVISVNSTAANRFWIASTSSNWNNVANWANHSGGPGGFSVPGSGDNATFDNNGLANCTIDIPVGVRSIDMAAGYRGTITQGANTVSTQKNFTCSSGTFTGGTANMTVGGSFSLTGGSFTGGSGNITIGNNASFNGGIFNGGSANITISGNYTLNGSSFTSTSTVLELNGNAAFTSAGFVNNNGTLRFSATGTTTISGLSPVFYNLEFRGAGFNYNITSAGNIIVANELDLTGNLFYNLNTGTIDVTGDINVTNSALGCGGTALVNINGTGIQNFTGGTVAGQGAMPQLRINKPSGSLNLFNFPASSNNFTYTTGTVNAGTSTFCFLNGSASPYTISGSISLNNIEFLASVNQTFTIPAATILTAAGDIIMAGTNSIILNTGNININGNIILTNTSTAGGGTTSINIIGAGNETIDGTAISISQNILPYININKAGGTLTMKGNISVSRDWTYASGTVDAGSFNSTIAFGGNNLNVTSAGMGFYNLTITGNVITPVNNLTINNNLSIAGGSLAAGSSTISIAGNWNNYGTAGFTEGTSTVQFMGAGVQTITSPGGEDFTNLTINNSGAGIQLNNNPTIATSFTMTQGNINLNGKTMTLGLSVANNGTLTYTSGTLYGTGTFIRWFKTGVIPNGSMNGLFPMGTASDYRPFFVSAPVTGPTTGGTIRVSYNDATTNTSIPTYLDGAVTIQVRKDLNWAVATGNGFAGGTFNLDVQGTGYGLIGAVSDLRLTLANSVVGLPGINAGTTSNPQINRIGLTPGNLTNSFYIGSINAVNTPLPITLISFTASVINREVLLKWTTSAEINNDYFTIQRSTDVIAWENIQKIPGAGNSGNSISYSTKDANPYSGISYYRLMQTDIDGKSTYSFIISINIGKKVSEILVFPNPAKGQVKVVFPGAGKYVLVIFNNNGQQMIEPVTINGSNTVLNLSVLKTGLYYLQISHEGTYETRKIMIGK